MKQPTLYKLSSVGNVQQWDITVNEGDAALDAAGAAYYFTTAGIKGGKMVVSKPVIVTEGKNLGRSNETTPREQAEAEATAKWTKKKDQGYTEDASNVSAARTAVNVPMTAKTYGKDVKPGSIRFPVASQAKLDGIRFKVARGEQHGLSKSGLPIVSSPHIVEAAQELFDAYPELESVDGELFNMDYIHDFDTISSLCLKKKMTPKLAAESREKVQFYVFDCEMTEGNDHGFARRYEFIAAAVAEHSPFGFVMVRTDVCNDQAALDFEMGRYLEEGHEGQMIRNLHAPYQRKRTADLVKRKEFFDGEWEITGYKEGKGNYAGTISFVCKLHGDKTRSDGTNTFDCPINASKEKLAWYYENRESFIGKWANVRYQNLTPEGIPRFLKCTGIREMHNGQSAY